jgi:hypothetical protein
VITSQNYGDFLLPVGRIFAANLHDQTPRNLCPTALAYILRTFGRRQNSPEQILQIHRSYCAK